MTQPAPIIQRPTDAPANLIQQLTSRTLDCIQQAAQFYNLRIQLPELDFRLRGKHAGQMCAERRFGKSRYRLRFNIRLADIHIEEFMNNVIPHEVSHLVVSIMYGWSRKSSRVKPHGPEWQEVMKQCFGCEPKVYHTLELPEAEARQKRATLQTYLYKCSCKDHQLTSIRHKRASINGVKYICTTCKTPLFPVEI